MTRGEDGMTQARSNDEASRAQALESLAVGIGNGYFATGPCWDIRVSPFVLLSELAPVQGGRAQEASAY